MFASHVLFISTRLTLFSKLGVKMHFATINGVAVEGVVVEWDWIVVLSLEIMYNNIVRWLEICNNQTLF